MIVWRLLASWGPRPARQIERTDDNPTNPVRRSIVYFANPDLDGTLWQFDAEGVEWGKSSVDDLFAQLEKKLTQYS